VEFDLWDVEVLRVVKDVWSKKLENEGDNVRTEVRKGERDQKREEYT